MPNYTVAWIIRVLMDWKTTLCKPKISQLQVLKQPNRRGKKKKRHKKIMYCSNIRHCSWEAFSQQILFRNKDRQLQYTNFFPALLSSGTGDKSTCTTCLTIPANRTNRTANFHCFYFVLMYSHFLCKAIYSAWTICNNIQYMFCAT